MDMQWQLLQEFLVKHGDANTTKNIGEHGEDKKEKNENEKLKHSCEICKLYIWH